jgi:hypothetical protein
MSTWPTSMLGVAERVQALDPARSMDAVVARLLEIERENDGYRNPDRRPRSRRLRRSVRRPDGVACFNYLYLRVSEEIRANLAAFESPSAVQRLAVVFAEFYLTAYRASAGGAWVSKAWAPLFEERLNRRVTPTQFALAGMNAHINNDLPWALMQCWQESGAESPTGSPEHADFERVNRILGRVQGEVRATLESGFLRWLDRALGRVDDVVATVSIARARDEAWQRADRWRRHFDAEAAAAHERDVGYQSHLILAV